MSPAQAGPGGVSIVTTRKFFVFAMTVVGFISLSGSGEVNPLVMGAFALATIGAWFWEEPRIDFKRWQTPWTVLTLLVFTWTMLDILFIGEFFLTSAMYFVVFLAGAKLFQLAEDKDFTQSMALSLLLLASGSVLNEALSFGVAFMAYVICSTLALTVQHLNVEVTEQHGSGRSRTRVEAIILWSALGLAVLIFLGSIAFFFAFPRIGFGLFVQNNRTGVATSGFGDTVELGGHGTIREDGTVIMRVKFPNGPPDNPAGLYFRGLSLDNYDGRSWRDEDDYGQNHSVQRELEGRGYLIGEATDGTWEEATDGAIVTDVYLEPLQSDVLFSVGHFTALGLPDDVTDLPENWFGRSVRADLTGEVSLSQRSTQGVMYRAYSQENLPTIDALREARYADLGDSLTEIIDLAVRRLAEEQGQPLPPDYAPLSEASLGNLAANGNQRGRFHARLARHYLQLPDGQITDRMRAWVNERRATNPLDVDFALEVQRSLRTLEYTTDLPRPSGPDANLVDEFLFDWQRGHCEYFATAMVVLLRTGGVPARIVNGFLGADFNQIGTYYSVRQANAHSWVEVYFPELGWVRFDPTPAGAPSFGDGGFIDRMRQAIDSLRLTWFRWVVEYDVEKQANAIRDVVESLQGSENAERTALDFSAWVHNAVRWLWQHLLAITLLILFWFIAAAVYRRRSLNRMPWHTLDWGLGVGWAVLATGVIVQAWPNPDWIAAVVTYPPIAITVFLAWQLRKDLFDLGQGRKGRSRGGDFVSNLYARLLRTAEKELGELPLSLSSAELQHQLDLREPELRAELQAFIDLYERVRFAGETVTEDEITEWRKRFRPMVKRMVKDLRLQLSEG